MTIALRLRQSAIDIPKNGPQQAISAAASGAQSVVSLGHRLERDRLDAIRLPGASEGLEARLAYPARSLLGRNQRLARIEIARILGKGLAHRSGHRQTDVGIDIHFAHPAADAALDLLHRHAVGLLDVAAVLANDFEPL